MKADHLQRIIENHLANEVVILGNPRTEKFKLEDEEHGITHLSFSLNEVNYAIVLEYVIPEGEGLPNEVTIIAFDRELSGAYRDDLPLSINGETVDDGEPTGEWIVLLTKILVVAMKMK